MIFVLFVTLTIFGVQAQPTYEDAERKFQELESLSISIQSNTRIILDNEAATLWDHLNELHDLTAQEIDNQIGNITETITQMAENVRSTTGKNVDLCISTSKSDLESFGRDMTDSLTECTSSMYTIGTDLLYAAEDKMDLEYDMDYRCTKMVFYECKNFENERCCACAVDSSINAAKDNMLRAYEVFQTDMRNQILGLNPLCRQMIVQELALYPSLILDVAKSCLDHLVASYYGSFLYCK